MKYRYGFAAFLAAFILQSTIVYHISVFGVVPNLILVLVIAFSFLFEDKQGMVFGILFGLLQDVLFSEVIGISALCYFLVSLGTSEIKRFLYRDNIISVAFISAGGTVVYNLLNWALSAMFGGIYGVLYFLARLPIAIIVNFFILIPVYWFIVRKVIKYRGFKYL